MGTEIRLRLGHIWEGHKHLIVCSVAGAVVGWAWWWIPNSECLSSFSCSLTAWLGDLSGAGVRGPVALGFTAGAGIGSRLDMLFKDLRRRAEAAEESEKAAKELAKTAQQTLTKELGRMTAARAEEETRAAERHQELMDAIKALTDEISGLSRRWRGGPRRRGRR